MAEVDVNAIPLDDRRGTGVAVLAVDLRRGSGLFAEGLDAAGPADRTRRPLRSGARTNRPYPTPGRPPSGIPARPGRQAKTNLAREAPSSTSRSAPSSRTAADRPTCCDPVRSGRGTQAKRPRPERRRSRATRARRRRRFDNVTCGRSIIAKGGAGGAKQLAIVTQFHRFRQSEPQAHAVCHVQRRTRCLERGRCGLSTAPGTVPAHLRRRSAVEHMSVRFRYSREALPTGGEAVSSGHFMTAKRMARGLPYSAMFSQLGAKPERTEASNLENPTSGKARGAKHTVAASSGPRHICRRWQTLCLGLSYARSPRVCGSVPAVSGPAACGPGRPLGSALPAGSPICGGRRRLNATARRPTMKRLSSELARMACLRSASTLRFPDRSAAHGQGIPHAEAERAGRDAMGRGNLHGLHHLGPGAAKGVNRNGLSVRFARRSRSPV